MKASVDFDDPRWNPDEVKERLAGAVLKSRRELTAQVEAVHREGGVKASGETYTRRGRRHRSSSRGNAPAPDSNTLMNAIMDREIGDLSGEVFIYEAINPSGGVADVYGAILDDPAKLNRPFFQKTAEGYQDNFYKNCEEALKK